MKRFTHKSPQSVFSTRGLLLTLVLMATGGIAASEAQAQGGMYGFQPFGFYQPYGIQYRSSVPTPPYFSVNPPVYYGTRHHRPYGISPFATPPQVTAPAGYEGQPAPQGIRSRHYSGPVGNPFVCRSDSPSASTSNTVAVSPADFTPGKVQTNPFAAEEIYVASKQPNQGI